jgi:hypothetical protein
MNEITDCAANHPDNYWPPAEAHELYKNLIFNCVVFQYDDGGFIAASADAKGIYGYGNSQDDVLEDLILAIECRVFDKQGGIHRGTSNQEYQNNYFYDLEKDCEADGVKMMNKFHCTVSVFSFLQNYLDSLDAGMNSNVDDFFDYNAYFDFLRTLKRNKNVMR